MHVGVTVLRTLLAIAFFPPTFFIYLFSRILCAIFLCNKKYRSPCSFKRKGPSHQFNYTSARYREFALRERKDGVFALSTISTLSLSFLFLLCHKFPPLFPNYAFPKTPIFLACELSGKEIRHYILLPITCYYAQYRMRSAILRNHLRKKKKKKKRTEVTATL